MPPRRPLGDREVFPVGLGAMPLSLEGRPDEGRALATIDAALEAGVELIDTADVYSRDEVDLGHNEELVARALRGRRDGVLVATKGGMVRRGAEWAVHGTPEHLRAACEASLRRLETDRIDLYQLHRPDPAVPFSEQVGALRDLRAEGKVVEIGLSNVSVEQIEEALAIVPVAAVQNELSPRYPESVTRGELDCCTRHGIAFLPYSPLGGLRRAGSLSRELDAVRRVAAHHGVSPQRALLAGLLALGPTVIPIPGASRPETIRDSAAAAQLELATEERRALAELLGVRAATAPPEGDAGDLEVVR